MPPASPSKPLWVKAKLIILIKALSWLALGAATLWATGALFFDAAPWLAFLYVVLISGLVWKATTTRWKKSVPLIGAMLVATWWLTLQPSNDRDWQADVAKMPTAEINGNQVTISHVRHFEYRSEEDYTPRWETRTVNLDQLFAMDFIVSYWSSEWICHTLVSFNFHDSPPLCFSIETRKEKGESYSAIRGFYRQFELVYICADERDLVQLRTHHRDTDGEDVYLYRLNLSPQEIRQHFMDYLTEMNKLAQRPRWYNAVTANCTTGIRSQRHRKERIMWDWRILVNGYVDEMLAERGGLRGDLPFAQLKAQALIDPAAISSSQAPSFSHAIREGKVGF